MNRRGFVSMLLGAAGAPPVPWRGLVEPLIVLPAREAPHVCGGSTWCHHPSHFKPRTPEEIVADIERAFGYVGYTARLTPTRISVDWQSGQLSVGGYYGPPIATPHSPQFLTEGFSP